MGDLHKVGRNEKLDAKERMGRVGRRGKKDEAGKDAGRRAPAGPSLPDLQGASYGDFSPDLLSHGSKCSVIDQRAFEIRGLNSSVSVEESVTCANAPHQ